VADRDFQIIVDILGDSRSFRDALKTGQQSLRDFNSELGAMNRALGGSVTAVRALRDNTKDAAVSVGMLGRATDSLTGQTRKLRDEMMAEITAVRAAARGQKDMADSSVRLAGAQRALAASIREVAGDQDKVLRAAVEAAMALEKEAGAAKDAADGLDEKGGASLRAADDQEKLLLATIKAAVALEDEARAAEETSRKLLEQAAAEEAAAEASRRNADRQVESASRTKAAWAAFAGVGWGAGGGHLRIPGAPLLSALLGVGGGVGLAHILGLSGEHIATAIGSVLGSGLSAGAGAASLGAGVVGQSLVGGGSDLAVAKSTITDTRALGQAYNTLQQDVAVFGKNSTQAAEAQAQLNYQMKQLGPIATAELAVFKQLSGINSLFDQKTQAARRGVLELIKELEPIAKTYIPLIGEAAARNFAIIDKAILPLRDWLDGKNGGVKIFQDLENHFAKGLPTEIHAVTQGLELMFRWIDLADKRTGSLSQHIDHLVTRLNSESNAQLQGHLDKLLTSLHVWENFLKAGARDLYLLFHAGDQEGQKMLVVFTRWLTKFGDWEKSVKGQDFLKTFFANRTKELLALLRILPPIAKAFGGMYASLQPLVPLITDAANGIADLFNWLEKASPLMASLAASYVLFRGKIGGGSIGTDIKGLLSHIPGVGSLVKDSASMRGQSPATPLYTYQVNSTPGTPGNPAAPEEAAAGGAASGLRDLLGLGSLSAGGAAATVAGIAGIEELASGQLFDGVNGSDAVKKYGDAAKLTKTQIDALKQSLGDLAGTGRNSYPWSMDELDLIKQFTGLLDDAQTHGGILNQGALDGLIARAKDLEREFPMAKAQLQPLIDKMQQAAQTVVPHLGTAFANLNHNQLQALIPTFQQLAGDAHASLKQIEDDSTTASLVIPAVLGKGSTTAKDILAKSFQQAASDIATQMQHGAISVDKGIQAINKLLSQALSALGVKVPKGISLSVGQASGLINTITGGIGSPGSLPTLGAAPPGLPKASGGIMGNPNAAGHDMYHVVMGEGEAVVTRHQRSMIDSYLPRGYSTAGIIGAQRTPNYMSQGGILGMASGGIAGTDGYVNPNGPGAITERTDQGKDFGGAFNVMAMGPGKVVRNTIWPGWPGTGGVVYRLNAGPRAGSMVFVMEDFMASVRPGQMLTPGEIIGRATGGSSGIEEGWANPSGTGPLTPYGGNPDGTPMAGGSNYASFISGLARGKITGSANPFSVAAPTLTVPQLGIGGSLGSLAQGAVNKYGSAAQSYLDQNANAAGMNASAPGGGGVAPSAWMQVAAQLAKQHGWGPGELQAWVGVENIEDSSYSLTAKNPTSPAYGLAQGITGPGWYYGEGGNPNTLLGQLTAMANYIAKRYGTPSAALAHEHSAGWYSMGGIVSGAFTPDIRRRRPTVATNNGQAGGASTTTSKSKPKYYKPSHKQPPRLKGITHIPGVPGLVDPFDYFYDDHAVVPNVMNPGAIRYQTYAGGNAQSITDMGGDAWTYLTGILGLIDTVDPTTGDPITNAGYIYGPNQYYQGDPANPQGYAQAYIDDQEIAARLAIYYAELGESKGAPRELNRLNKWIGRTQTKAKKYADQGTAVAGDIGHWQHMENYIKVKKTHENFSQEKLDIRQKYEKALTDLTIKRIKGTLNIDSLYNAARSTLMGERGQEMAGLFSNKDLMLDDTSRNLVRNEILTYFDQRLQNLQTLRQQASAKGQIDAAKARLFIHLAEEDSLQAIDRREQGYTTKKVMLQEAIDKETPILKTDEKDLGILARDLKAADGSVPSGIARAMLKLGVDASQITSPYSAASGATNIRDEIKSRIAALNGPAGYQYEKDVTIAGLIKNRNEITGSTSSNPAGTVDTSLTDSLNQQAAALAAENFAVAEAQLKALSSFTPLLGRMVGSYAGGTYGGTIPQTGLALVHRGETITPDPQGPYGTQPGMAGTSAAVGNIELNLTLNGTLALLAPYIQAVVAKTAAGHVSQQVGVRTRILQGAPGR